MGRTLPTQIQLLREEEEAWKSYRRALRKEDQAAFDQVWSYTRRHAMASSMASRVIPMEAHLLSMIIGLERDLQDLKQFLFEGESTNSPARPKKGRAGEVSSLKTAKTPK